MALGFGTGLPYAHSLGSGVTTGAHFTYGPELLTQGPSPSNWTKDLSTIGGGVLRTADVTDPQDWNGINIETVTDDSATHFEGRLHTPVVMPSFRFHRFIGYIDFNGAASSTGDSLTVYGIINGGNTGFFATTNITTKAVTPGQFGSGFAAPSELVFNKVNDVDDVWRIEFVTFNNASQQPNIGVITTGAPNSGVGNIRVGGYSFKRRFLNGA